MLKSLLLKVKLKTNFLNLNSYKVPPFYLESQIMTGHQIDQS